MEDVVHPVRAISRILRSPRVRFAFPTVKGGTVRLNVFFPSKSDLSAAKGHVASEIAAAVEYLVSEFPAYVANTTRLGVRRHVHDLRNSLANSYGLPEHSEFYQGSFGLAYALSTAACHCAPSSELLRLISVASPIWVTGLVYSNGTVPTFPDQNIFNDKIRCFLESNNRGVLIVPASNWTIFDKTFGPFNDLNVTPPNELANVLKSSSNLPKTSRLRFVICVGNKADDLRTLVDVLFRRRLSIDVADKWEDDVIWMFNLLFSLASVSMTI